MTEYWFYHLQDTKLEKVLPDLLEKTLSRAWTSFICTTTNRIEYWDKYLWTYQSHSFLPHGRDDEPLSDSQPILLGEHIPSERKFDCIFYVDTVISVVEPDIGRCIGFIDGQDPENVRTARDVWRDMSQLSLKLSYWQQNDGGGWDKKA